MVINLPQFGHVTLPFTLAFLLASLGCDSSRRNTETAASGVTVDNITDDPTPFLGQTVTVTGEVGRIGGPQIFTIEDSDPMGDEHLLVVSARPVTQILVGARDPFGDDDEVEVSGTVRRLTVTEIERELGFDLEPEYEVEFRNQPVLVATSVRQTSQASGASPTVTDVLVLVPVPGPSELVGRRVELAGVPVQAVVSDKGFWIGPNPEQRVFVRLNEVGPDGASTEHKVKVREGQRLTLFGRVERVPPRSQVDSQWGLSQAESKSVTRNEALYIAADSARVQKA